MPNPHTFTGDPLVFWDFQQTKRCRYLVVDAYNEDVPVAFYKKNGFDFMFSTEEQEKSYFLGGYEKSRTFGKLYK